MNFRKTTNHYFQTSNHFLDFNIEPPSMKQDHSYCYLFFCLAQHLNQLEFKNFIHLASDLVTTTTSFIFIQITFTIHSLFFENYFAEIAHSANTQKDCSRIYFRYFIIPLPTLSFSAGLKLIKMS